MTNSKKGGTVEFAPIIASGLLLTAEELYRKMLANQKKNKKGGMAEVGAVTPAASGKVPSPPVPSVPVPSPLVPSPPVPTPAGQQGGKPRKNSKSKPNPKGKKRGGNDDIDMAGGNFLTDSVETVTKTVTDAIQGTPQQGGSRSRKGGRTKKGGDSLQQQLDAVLNQEGGRKTPKRGRKPKRGGYEEVVSNNDMAITDSAENTGFTQDTELEASVPPTNGGQEGGKGKKGKKGKKAVKKGKKKGGNEILSLYSEQLNGLANGLNSVVNG